MPRRVLKDRQIYFDEGLVDGILEGIYERSVQLVLNLQGLKPKSLTHLMNLELDRLIAMLVQPFDVLVHRSMVCLCSNMN